MVNFLPEEHTQVKQDCKGQCLQQLGTLNAAAAALITETISNQEVINVHLNYGRICVIPLSILRPYSQAKITSTYLEQFDVCNYVS